MTDEKKEEEEITEEDVSALQKEIEEGGTRANADVFSLLPGKEAVIFIIKNPPGGEGKALAMELPLPLAVQLGNALVNTAIIAAGLEKEEEEKEKKIVWH